MTRRARIVSALIFAGVGFVILCGFGFWQVQRLAWKEALIAQLDAALLADPLPLAEALSRQGADLDFVKVTVSGGFEGIILRKFAAIPGGAGWEIIQGFRAGGGAILLVSRGVEAEGQSAPDAPPTMDVTGILRRHGQGKGSFDPDNDPDSNRWYWWDVPAMYLAVTGEAVRHGELVLHLLPGTPGTEGLLVEEPKAALRNNHLGYAITWFGLAAALAAVAFAYVRGQMKKSGA